METRSLLSLHRAPLLEEVVHLRVECLEVSTQEEKILHVLSVQSLTAVNSLINICPKDELHTKGSNFMPVSALDRPYAGHP